MPELPEVETVRRGLEPWLAGARIEKVTLNRKDLRFPFPRGLKSALEGKTIGILENGKLNAAEMLHEVAALFEAMTRATGVPMQLESYQVHSIGIGADARGEANLSVRCDGVEHAGLGTSRDIIEASALAWLDVANRVIRQREAASTSLAATA